MTCTSCGSQLLPIVGDLPFKTSGNTIVIVRALPFLQCQNCSEYLIDDDVLRRVDEILTRVAGTTELEVIRYAA